MDAENTTPKRLYIIIILLGVLMILGGTLFGIVLPIYRSYRSGHTIISQSVGNDETITVDLDPQMNPIRIGGRIDYWAPSQQRDMESITIHATLRHQDEMIWDKNIAVGRGFDHDDDRFVRAGDVHQGYNLETFHIDASDQYQYRQTVTLPDGYRLQQINLEIRRNVQPVDVTAIIIGAVLIPLGIAAILITALLWARQG
ncbi:hypothetical protein [Crateriforma conspicua]|uniref:Uncharacterized protein n=1 Tax=Crateriforma conspicua TaxID=2527996 RepID=A0A5C5Y9J3_9PLAN|nr:hypothetical protein [Crateriforma conspicua]TWT71121.1 hypothetical protein Pan14r_34310 [Crateriforma conspicua]